jgi:hypothetical protein
VGLGLLGKHSSSLGSEEHLRQYAPVMQPHCTNSAATTENTPVHVLIVSSSLLSFRCSPGRYLYIELHQPYRNDHEPTVRGIAIRMMGDLSKCTSTRAVPLFVDSSGKQQYLLNTPDPTGVAVGSRYEDPVRGVSVVLEEWSRAKAVVRIRG